MTRLIYLLLLLLCTPESSESKIAKFGCLFDDTHFNLDLKFPGKAKFGMIYPVLGEMYFADDKSLQTFLNKITDVYSNFFKTGLTYDSLSNYIGFYKKYAADKDCPKFNNVSTLYAEYKGINLGYEPGGNMIALMKKLVNDLASLFPELERSSYFVTRSTVSIEKWQNVTEQKSKTLPGFFKHEQIAGIIKFKNSSYYYGYILLDPEIGVYKPVVFMEDEHNPTNYDNKNENIKFRIPEPKNILKIASQFITAEVNDGSNFIYLYYYRKPFCSMVETTMKPSILKFQHSREKRDSKLVTVASFTAHVGLADPKGVAKNSHETLYDVEFKFLEEGKYETLNNFPVVDALRMRGYVQEDINDKRCKQLGTSQNNLIDDILLLQVIRNDNKFLKQCESTLKQLDNA